MRHMPVVTALCAAIVLTLPAIAHGASKRDTAALRALSSVDAGLRGVPARNLSKKTRKQLLGAIKTARKSLARRNGCAALRVVEPLRTELLARGTYVKGRYPSKLARTLERLAASASRAIVRTRTTKRCAIVGTKGKPVRARRGAPTPIPVPTQPKDFEEGEVEAEPLKINPNAARPTPKESTGVATDPLAPSGGAAARAGGGPLAAAAQASRPFQARLITDLGVPPGGGPPQEPQVAQGGGVVVYSGNAGAFYSADSGRTFAALNPATIFGNFEGGFCCDTVIRYAPTIDRFIWLMQGVVDASGTNNRYVLAVASPADLRAAAAANRPPEDVWLIYDLTRPGFGETQTWFDFPHMAVGNRFLYMTWNRVGAGVVNVRLPLAELPRGRISWLYWRRNGETFWRIAQQSNGRGVWLRNITGRDDRAMAHIVEDSSDVMVEYGLPHDALPQRDYTSLTPLGENWADRAGGAGVKAAVIRRDELWVGWTAGRGFQNETTNRFTQPHVQYAVYRLPRPGSRISDPLEVVGQGNVFNDGVAIVDPSFAVDSEGQVAMNASFGGPSNAPGPLVGYLTDGSSTLFSWFRADATTAGGARSQGDYSMIAPAYPNERELIASGYSAWVEPQGPRTHYGVIRFGRGIGATPRSTTTSVACPGPLAPGTPAAVTGNVTPSLSGVEIVLRYSLQGSTDAITRRVITDGQGRFSDVFPYGSAGTWTIRASYAGTGQFRGSEGTCTVNAVAPAPNQPPLPASLTLSCPSSGGFVGDTIAVTGALTPAISAATIEVRYQPQGGAEVLHTVSTDTQGRYNDTYATTLSGNLTIRTRFPGNAQSGAADGPPCTRYVQPVPS